MIPDRVSKRLRSAVRPIGTAAVLCAIVVPLTACGSDSDSGSGGSAGGSTTETAPDYLQGLSGVVRFNQSGGELEQGFNQAFVDDFEELSGVKVVYSSPQGGLARLKAMHDAGNMQWDMLELGGLGDLLSAQDQGLLEKVDYSGIDVSQFPKQFIQEYGFDYGPSGSVLIWNKDKWPDDGKHPESVLDLFNTEEFPGKRCMLGASPATNGILEYAAMASGVPKEDVYPIDLDRAFGELDKIKDDAVWWESGAESIQYLLDGQCDMGTTWSGRPAIRLKEDPSLPIGGTFEDAMIGGGWFAIPDGAENAENARALMRYYLQRSVQVDMCNTIAYCLDMPGLQKEIDPGMQPWVPLGVNLENTFPEDGKYWAENLPDVTTRWNEWMSN